VEEYLGGDNFHLWTRDPTVINDLGVVLSKIPVSPKYGKMLVASHKYPGLLTYAIMIVACMSVPEVYNQ
jgi:HrpA-like RNA helicase